MVKRAAQLSETSAKGDTFDPLRSPIGARITRKSPIQLWFAVCPARIHCKTGAESTSNEDVIMSWLPIWREEGMPTRAPSAVS